MPLEHEPTSLLNIGFPAACGDTWIGLHALDKNLEIARRYAQIEVQFAEIVVVFRVSGVVPSVKGIHHSRAHRTSTSVVSSDDFYPIVSCAVLGEDVWRSVSGSVVHDYPPRGS